MTNISLLKCAKYDNTILRDCIEQSLHNIGFDTALFSNTRVALKPNLLSAEPPSKAIITHPEFFRAAAQVVKGYGGIPVLVESPGFISLDRALAKGEYLPVIRDERIEVADPSITKAIFSDKAINFKSFNVSSALQSVDIVLNLPKLKTHELTYMTCAVKNLFGTIYGLNKAKCHIKAQDNNRLSNLLLDLYTCLTHGFENNKYFIHIVDAVIGMEGEGPGTKGKPREIGLMIAGTDAIAVDYVAIQAIGLNPNNVITIISGAQRGLGIASMDEISLIGENIKNVQIRDYKPASHGFQTMILNFAFASKLFSKLFIKKPVPMEKKCTLCYHCKKICPAQAISESNGIIRTPQFDYNKCIRCYCCMEICPEAAISIKKSFIEKIVKKFIL